MCTWHNCLFSFLINMQLIPNINNTVIELSNLIYYFLFFLYSFHKNVDIKFIAHSAFL